MKKRMLIAKNSYNEKVKTEGWQDWAISRPFDTDPLCPEKINHFLSHYNRFGAKEDKWTTSTGDALDQIYLSRPYLRANSDKVIYNVHSFIR